METGYISSDKRGHLHNIFLFLHKNIGCGYHLVGIASNDYPQHKYSWRYKKNISMFLLHHRQPRRTEGDFQFDKAPGWAMPYCTTTQKSLTKLEFFFLHFFFFFTCTIYITHSNTDINIIQAIHTQFEAKLFMLACLGNYTGILFD